MNSVQENKNELEAAVRYCESAISRAQATIESMEFRQQAATKAWHERTGREEALQREVAELKAQLGEREDKWDDAMKENRELEELRGRNDELKKENAKLAASNARLLNKQQEMEQTMQLQKDQVAMFQRKMSRLNEVDR